MSKRSTYNDGTRTMTRHNWSSGGRHYTDDYSPSGERVSGTMTTDWDNNVYRTSVDQFGSTWAVEKIGEKK